VDVKGITKYNAALGIRESAIETGHGVEKYRFHFKLNV